MGTLLPKDMTRRRTTADTSFCNRCGKYRGARCTHCIACRSLFLLWHSGSSCLVPKEHACCSKGDHASMMPMVKQKCSQIAMSLQARGMHWSCSRCLTGWHHCYNCCSRRKDKNHLAETKRWSGQTCDGGAGKRYALESCSRCLTS